MFARTRDGISQHVVSQHATCYWAAKVSFRSTQASARPASPRRSR